jgi:hypothetical protein
VHRRKQELRQAGRAEDVYFELIAGFVDADVFDWAIKSKSGVVDEYVDTAGLRKDNLDIWPLSCG